jgi:tRNA (mo5U34)-methyltransferase
MKTMVINEQAFLQDFHPHGAQLLAMAADSPLKPEAVGQLTTRLPAAAPSIIDLDNPWVTIGRPADLSTVQHQALLSVLNELKPWRKGPFHFFGIAVDSEWDSSLKWARVAPHIAPLAGRRVLDVGCSNGYYLFRMAAAGPKVALGVDPYSRYFLQYCTLQHYIRVRQIHALPLGLEALNGLQGWFDTVFCMGVLYHCRSPLDTLVQLKTLLRPEGELVLETLILEDAAEICLVPGQRYAAMRNVYFIPTVPCLRNWLTKSGFSNIRCVDITRTTQTEQRKTAWIDSASLDSFLDPIDSRLTREGYPAPVRAVLLADAT